MPGTFRPSAGYAGRGVTLQSALEYMLYHQKSFAQVKPGTWRRAASQTFSPATRRFDCRQSQISARSRKYQPLPTMPCCRGSAPVSMLACALQVTAGNTALSGVMKPSRASAASAGVSDPTWADVSPTTSTTTSGGVSPPRGGATAIRSLTIGRSAPTSPRGPGRSPARHRRPGARLRAARTRCRSLPRSGL